MQDLGTSEQGKKPGWLNIWTFVLIAAGSVLGHYGTILVDYTKHSDRMETMSEKMDSLATDFKTFMVEYRSADKTTSNEIQQLKDEMERVNDHISHTDTRVDRMESLRR
jgi:uncharacterized membrane protein (DUF106 family)